MAHRKDILIAKNIPTKAYARTLLLRGGRHSVKSHTLTILVDVDGLLLALPVVNSGAKADTQHLAKFLRGKRCERLESDRKVSANLEADIQDRRSARHIRLRHLPRLGIRDILVSETRDCHRILQRFAEMISFNVLFQ